MTNVRIGVISVIGIIREKVTNDEVGTKNLCNSCNYMKIREKESV
jgi:hypothetical protein